MKIPSQPLNDAELERLDDFLLDRVDEDAVMEGMDEGILDISGLDGLLTAVVSGPVTIPPSKWLPLVWGNFEPAWKDEKDIEEIMSLLIRHMNSIAATLMEQPADFDPLFLERVVEGKTYTIVDEWCEGYMRGVVLAAEEWKLDSLEMKILLAPIKAFHGDQALKIYKEYSEQEILNLQGAISPNVREIHAYWLAHRSDQRALSTVVHEQPKIGRNDPCPCGSGKKYKKCCLH